jgi:transcriptional regulator with XRE-family HTH domain
MAVATAAGLSVPYVANLEKGRGNPTLDVIVGLAGALGVRPSELLAGDDEPGAQIDETFLGLPPVLVDYAQGRTHQGQTERIAAQGGLSVSETRSVLLQAMAAAPRPVRRALSKDDCRRLLDAYQLVLADPGDL